MERRDVLLLAVAASVGYQTRSKSGEPMYGLIGKITATSGHRDELIDILIGSTARMPGCLSYVVARDSTDADGIWISEVWDSKANHAASLALPAVREAIAKGRPLIAGFSNRVETIPVGGVGL
jgi:quinol monooxygenase YgiN